VVPRRERPATPSLKQVTPAIPIRLHGTTPSRHVDAARFNKQSWTRRGLFANCSRLSDSEEVTTFPTRNIRILRHHCITSNHPPIQPEILRSSGQSPQPPERSVTWVRGGAPLTHMTAKKAMNVTNVAGGF
jgi:hypothetical protein